MHDTLAAALRQKVIGSPRAWLATVARNLAHRRARRERQRRRVERAAGRPEAQPDTADLVERAALHRTVVDELLALPEPYRGTLLRRYLEGHALREVAHRTGVPVETARTRQKRGLAMLRARLDERWGDRRGWALPLAAAVTPHAVSLGVVLMSLPVKSALWATAVVATAVLLWSTRGPENAPAGSPSGTPAGSAEVAANLPAETPATVAEKRRPVEHRPPAPVAAPTAIVIGTVLDEETRQPVRDATVGWRARRPAPAGAVLATTASTDAGGRFELATRAEDPIENVELVVRAAHLAVTTHQLGTPEGAGSPLRIDVGEILLPPGTGIRGRVVDTGGLPVAGARLLFAPDWVFRSGKRRLARRCVQLYRALELGASTAAGTFALEHRVFDRGRNPLLLAVSPRGIGWVSLQVFRRRTELEGLEIRLAPSAALRVQVVDEHGEPRAHVGVVAEPRYPPFAVPSGSPLALGGSPVLSERLVRETDAQGVVHFTGLPVPAPGPADFSLAIDTGTTRLQRALRLRSGEQPDLRIVAPRAPRLAVRGRVVGPDGTGLGGVTVTASAGERHTARTGAAGRFAFDALPASRDSLRLTAELEGYTRAESERVLDLGDQPVEVELRLEPAAALRGVVVDQHGDPVAGADVDASGVADRTDRTGAFELPALASARRHRLSVSPPDGGSFEGWIEHLARPADSPLTLVLRRLPAGHARLRVELLDPDGRPAEAKELRLICLTDNPDRLAHPATARIGTIRADDLRDGEWALRVTPGRGHPLERHFTVTPDASEIDLRLQQKPPATIEGRIVGDLPESDWPATLQLGFGAGYATGRLALPGGEREGKSWLKLDPRRDHRFRVVDVDPSRPVRLLAHGDGFYGSAELRVAAGATASCELRLQRTASVTFKSNGPWPYDTMILHWRLAGETWREALHVETRAGATELLRWDFPPRALEWRVEVPTAGTDNRTAPPQASGTLQLAPGQRARVVLDAAAFAR